MSEKKVLKIEDEALQNVAGGSAGELSYDASMPSVDIMQKYEDPNTIYLTCPECGKDLGISTRVTPGFSTTMNGVCPHCNKEYSITV